MGRTIRALALPVLVLLLLVAQFPGLLRTNVELTATDRFASFAVEDLAAHFGARYSLPLMLRAVAPEADMILEGSIPLGEGGILPEHLVAIGTASTVARVGASPIVVPPALAAADVLLSGRDHRVGWTIVRSPGHDGAVDMPDVVVSPSPLSPSDLQIVILDRGRDVALGAAAEPVTSGSVVVRGVVRDVAVILGLVALGALLLRRPGRTVLTDPVAIPIALLSGAAVVTVATGLLVLIGLSTVALPVVTLSVLIAVTVAWWIPRRPAMAAQRSARSIVGTIVPWGVLALLVGSVSAVARNEGILSLTPDSMTLLSQAELLATDRFPVAFLTPEVLAKRMLSIPALHALGGPGAGPLVVLGPMLLVTIGLLTATLAHSIARRRLTRGPSLAIATIAAASVVSVERLLASALYINSHALIAAAVLAVLTVTLGRNPQVAAIGPLVALVALSRPEGALLAALVLLGIALSPAVGATVTRSSAPWWWLGGATILRQSIQLRAELGSDELEHTTVAMFVIGLGFMLLPVILRRIRRSMLLVLVFGGVGALWMMAVLTVVLDVGPARSALRATVTNIMGAGGWGSTFVLLGLAAMLAVRRAREDEFLPLVIPWLGFVPLGLLLAVLRGGAYRLGTGDSLNRMWVHLIPLLVLLVTLAAVGRRVTDTGAEEDRNQWPGRIEVMLSQRAGAVLVVALGAVVVIGAVVRPTVPLTSPVTLPPALSAHAPVGELVAGSTLVHTFASGLPALPHDARRPDTPLCVEVFAATYGGRRNDGVVTVQVHSVSGLFVGTLSMAALRDNEWAVVCPDGLRLDALASVRDGGTLRVIGIDGQPGSAATLWSTQDLTNGTLDDGAAALVHRFVVVEERRRALPAALIIALLAPLAALRRRPKRQGVGPDGAASEHRPGPPSPLGSTL